METESREEGARGCGEQEMGRWLSKGMASAVPDENSSGGWLHNKANVLNTTACTLKNG